jgi:hypothetical protein
MFLLVVSCNEHAMNKKEITVKGCVTDSISKAPIPGAKVTILCWYHSGWDKADYVNIDTIADINGCFSARFEEGYKIIVASVATKYYPNLKASEELNNSRVGINLELTKRADTIQVADPKINLRYYIVQNSSN